MTRTLDEQRAFEPVAQCLIRRLMVPDVYYDASVPGWTADLMVVDRAGSGDVHVVEIKSELDHGLLVARELVQAAPAHFRWVAYIDEGTPAPVGLAERPELRPADGAGRVGVIRIARMAGGDLGANVLVKGERFHGGYREATAEARGSRRPDHSFAVLRGLYPDICAA